MLVSQVPEATPPSDTKATSLGERLYTAFNKAMADDDPGRACGATGRTLTA